MVPTKQKSNKGPRAVVNHGSLAVRKPVASTQRFKAHQEGSVGQWNEHAGYRGAASSAERRLNSWFVRLKKLSAGSPRVNWQKQTSVRSPGGPGRRGAWYWAVSAPQTPLHENHRRWSPAM